MPISIRAGRAWFIDQRRVQERPEGCIIDVAIGELNGRSEIVEKKFAGHRHMARQ